MNFFNFFCFPDTTSYINDRDITFNSSNRKNETEDEIITNDIYVDILSSRTSSSSSKSSPIQKQSKPDIDELGAYYIADQPSSVSVNVAFLNYKLPTTQTHLSSKSSLSNHMYFNKKFSTRLKSIRKFLMDSSF